MDTNTNEIALLNDEIIKGNGKSKYKIIACAIRNNGTGWELIKDSTHQPVNVQYAVNDTDSIGLAYSFSATKVGTVVCVPDETFIQQGYSFGASGGTAVADIMISCNKDINAYVYTTDGINWNVLQGDIPITSVSFSSGILTINHVETNSLNVSAECKSGTALAFINNTSSTSTEIKITDFTGQVITNPTNIGLFFRRGMPKIINPNNVISNSGNVWVYGIMEI